MIKPVELFVGLRYLRAKRRTRFVSFITGVSMLGIAVGVAALIVILSVMNGFEGELRDRLLSMSAHGTIDTEDGGIDDWSSVVELIEADARVQAAAPLVSLEGMIQSGRELQGVLVHGVEPAAEQRLSGELMNVVEGSLDALAPGSRSIILGRLIALQIGARIGDDVLLLIPRPAGDGTVEPVLERFVMRGAFEVGLQDHDARLALVHVADAATILDLGSAVNAVRFRAFDVMQAPAVAADFDRQNPGYQTRDWTIENASYFRAIRLEKMMMSLILSLIIGVAERSAWGRAVSSGCSSCRARLSAGPVSLSASRSASSSPSTCRISRRGSRDCSTSRSCRATSTT